MRENLSSEEFTPFGGENLPFKEIEKEELPREEKNIKFKFFLMIFIIFISFIFLLTLKRQNFNFSPQPSWLPSPAHFSPSPTATGLVNNNIEEKIDLFEKKLKETDLQQTEFSFPLLDFAFSIGTKQ